MDNQFTLEVTRNHPQRGVEKVGELVFGEVIDFYIQEGMQFVVTPILDKKAPGGPAIVGLDITAYPDHYEMVQG